MKTQEQIIARAVQSARETGNLDWQEASAFAYSDALKQGYDEDEAENIAKEAGLQFEES